MAAKADTVILVAEDNEFDRLILREAFAELGLAVELRFVADGQDMLDYVNRRHAFADEEFSPRPHVLLLDLNMPRMTGHEALQELRADPVGRLLPVIVLSTSESERQIMQAYANGANAFVTKPGRFDEFVAVLRNFAAFWLNTAKLPLLSAMM